MKEQTEKWYNKNYKLLLIIPVALLLFSLIYMAIFYSNNQDLIYKDISLTGGTSVTIFGKINLFDLEQTLSEKLEEVNIREISNLITREQKAVIIEIKTEGCNELDVKQTKKILEDYLGYELVEGDNASFECTGSSLSESFYKQLLVAILFAFFFMAIVVFIIFRTFVPSMTVILSAFADILMALTLVNIFGNENVERRNYRVADAYWVFC